jgi:nickel-dependent lactate racemase
MHLHLDYGKGRLAVELPDDSTVLNMVPTSGLDSPPEQVRAGLETPLGVAPLAKLAAGKRDACVVISDITRPVPNEIILPEVLAVLENSGIARDAITILIGTGLHRPNEGTELIELVGKSVASRYRIINHFARQHDQLTHLGETPMGMPIWVNSTFANADLKIAVSLIEPHLMAGYSGGRKAICPGICGVETIRFFHGPEILSHPNATEGCIEGNPVHEQSLAVARTVGVGFSVNVTMNEDRQVTGVFCGELEVAHAAGVRYVQEQASAFVDTPADIVVTSSAGHPLDLTLYQAVKGLTAVLPVVKEGGTIIIAARCEEGIGSPEFTDLLFSVETVDEFLSRIREPGFFVVDQWQLQELCKVIKKADVWLYSEGVSSRMTSLPLFQLASSVGAAVGAATERHGPGARLAVVPSGPYVLPQLRGAA